MITVDTKPSPAAEVKTGETGRVLVIEDNELNCKLIRSLLTIYNFAIIEAEDAETGVRMAESHLPDLILMDIQLPGMSGLEATKILKANDALKNIKIIALTAHAMDGDLEKAMAAGCDGFITKPINTRNFVKDILQFLPQSSLSAKKTLG